MDPSLDTTTTTLNVTFISIESNINHQTKRTLQNRYSSSVGNDIEHLLHDMSESEESSMIFPDCLLDLSDLTSSNSANSQDYRDDIILDASLTPSESSNEPKSNTSQTSSSAFDNSSKSSPKERVRSNAQQGKISKPKISSCSLSTRLSNAWTNITRRNSRMRRRSRRAKKISSPPKHSKEYQDLGYRIQEKHEHFLKGWETSTLYDTPSSPGSDLKSLTVDPGTPRSHRTSQITGNQSISISRQSESHTNNYRHKGMKVLDTGRNTMINENDHNISTHVHRNHHTSHTAVVEYHDDIDDDSSITSCIDSISSYKSIKHRANSKHYSSRKVAGSANDCQHLTSGDEDCSSIASQNITNSMISCHISRGHARDMNVTQPNDSGYSSRSGIHDDDSSFWSYSSANSSCYSIHSQPESESLSDSVSIISDADPLAKPSKRVSRYAVKADGDVWVERMLRSKLTGERRTFFVSVQTGKRTRDEPPTGASKVIYKDTKYVTNLDTVSVPLVVSFQIEK